MIKRKLQSMSWTKQALLNLLDTIQEGVFVIDKNHRITFFNPAAEKISGTNKKEAVGRLCWEVLRADCGGDECPLKKTLATGELFTERIVTMISSNGMRKTISIATTVLRNDNGDITGAIETFRDLSSEESQLHSLISNYRYNIITINPKMLKTIGTLPMIAESDSTVLLQGESGTGKELFARALHNLSPRKDKPFIAVNCGALPDNLLESELFGYKAGAFTDAKKDKPGRFALAERGVILLDEIGDTSPAMQVKLLRVIQEKEYEPLGSTKSIKADVRIIVATNQDLYKMVNKATFRKDLYYRISVINIVIPPLRERREDIPLLIDYYITKLNKQQKKQIRGIDDDAMACLIAHDYPGNVRELENSIERAFVLCNKGYIQKKHLPETVCHDNIANWENTDIKSINGIEAAFLMNALKRNKWDRQKTAKELGIHRTSLYRKMRALSIYPKENNTEIEKAGKI